MNAIPGMGLEADDCLLGSEKLMIERGLSVPSPSGVGTISYLAKGKS
jgi:hypothetical protein